jgi:hypothetical protein
MRPDRPSRREEVSSVQGIARAFDRLPDDLPVVIWTSGEWGDLLARIWLLDALLEMEVDPGRLFTAPCRFTWRGGSLAHPRWKARPRRLPDGALAEGSTLWRAFASPSPVGFDAIRRAGSRSFPALEIAGREHGASFPRIQRGSRRLRLSVLDEALLLGLAGGSWRPAIEVVVDSWFPLMPRSGDLLAFARLRTWARHRPGRPAVLERQGTETSPRANRLYRLTAHGERLLERGMDSVDDAPPLWIGGCQVHHPAAPWVRRDDRADYRIERL